MGSALRVMVPLGALLLAGCAAATPSPLPTVRQVLALRPAGTTVRLTPGQPPYLTAIAFATGRIGWAGGQGVILGTSDGGAQWRTEYRGARSVAGIASLSPDVAYAATTAGLLGTRDGRTWRRIGRETLAALDFVSQSRGFGLAYQRDGLRSSPDRLVATSDGGRTWARLPVAPVSSLCFFSAETGLVVAQRGALGPVDILRTTDGGWHWSRVLQFRSGGASLRCTRDGGAWLLAVGGAGMSQASYAVFRTADLGLTWRPVLARPTAGGGPPPGDTRGAPPGPGSSPGALLALSRSTAAMVGTCEACAEVGTAALAVTTDGGAHWTSVPAAVPVLSAQILGGQMVSSRRIVLLDSGGAAGAQSQVLATADGGALWRTLLLQPRSLPPYDVAYAGRNVLYGIGDPSSSGAVYRSRDGGRDWQVSGRLPARVAALDVGPLAAADGYLYAVVGGAALRSADGGRHWRILASGLPYASELAFASRQAGCASYPAAGSGALQDLSTADGGRTWRQAALQDVPAAVCALPPSARGLADLAQGLVRRLTASRGRFGSPAYAMSLAGVGHGSVWLAFTGSPTGRLYVLSSGRAASVATWPQDLVGPLALEVMGPRAARLLTGDGRILATDDAGRHWTQIP